MLVPLVVAPLLGLGWLAYVQLNDTSEAKALVEAETKMRQVAMQIMSIVRTAKANAELFSSSGLLDEYFWTKDEWTRYYIMAPPLQRLFANCNRAYPDYYEIRVILPNGIEDVRFTRRDLPNQTENEASTEYFQGMTRDESDLYSCFYRNKDNAQMTLYVSKRILLRDIDDDPSSPNRKLRGYLVITVSLEPIYSLIRENRIGERGRLFLTDQRGNVLFHPDVQDNNTPIPEERFQQLIDLATQGGSVKMLHEDLGRAIFFGKKIDKNFFLFASLPEQELMVASRMLGAAVAGITLVAVLFTTTLLYIVLTAILIRPIHALGTAARAIGRGRFLTKINVKAHDEIGELSGTLQDMGQRLQQSHDQIRTALNEKEVLLREIHHRVKNNLELISSLLEMSRMRTDNQAAIEQLTDARSRIHSISLIHKQLYQSDHFHRINMETHIRGLAGYLSEAHAVKGRSIDVVVEPSDVHLSVNQAIPCSFVLNELISNAFKHAFKEKEQRKIEISIRRRGNDMIVMKVKDEGVGMPDDVDIDKIETLGFKLVKTLVRQQLRGTLQINRNDGTEVIIEFELLRDEDKDDQGYAGGG
jgi:two-component sensor histidine kinase